jgi:hypothetical protein
MRLPNFFIIGAPKCGTTSIFDWLREHPNVYMSPLKEPRYFDRDLRMRARISKAAYMDLFRRAGEQHLAIGEATVWYLYSREAVPNIEREIPGARYIVLVRNPVDMAYALHEQLSLNGAEPIRNFGRAWEMSPIRRRGQGVLGVFLSEPRLLDYQLVCRLGDQVEYLFSLVPRERILVLVLDDIRDNPRREYVKVLDFLGVPDDGREHFHVRNPAKQVRSHLLQNIIVLGMKGERVVKERLGLSPVNSAFFKALNAWNKVARPRPPLPEELRAQMEAYFASDILKLGRLLGRDFSHWLGTSSPAKGKNA